jgi:hypothetical protein
MSSVSELVPEAAEETVDSTGAEVEVVDTVALSEVEQPTNTDKGSNKMHSTRLRYWAFNKGHAPSWTATITLVETSHPSRHA